LNGRRNFHSVTLWSLTQTGSGHTPLLLHAAHLGINSHFSFELSWMRNEGIFEMVRDAWFSVAVGDSPVDKWQNNIRFLRQYLQGWACNMSGVL
jgi:hypothetical protein